jgi:hypothetical protein
MTTSSFLLALRWMFNQERLATDYERMLEPIDRIQPSLKQRVEIGIDNP